MEVLVLHHYPELLEKCCDLINSEWPRSKTARIRGLECSCDNFPTCLVLVQKGLQEVIGHSKISRIPSIPSGAFIESVVIQRALRGKGLGRLLMLHTEEYMKSKGLSESYLSTYDQQAFYTKLGYVFCERVSIYGAAMPLLYQDEEISTKLLGQLNLTDDKVKQTPLAPPPSNGFFPPPPPPPPPAPSMHTPKTLSTPRFKSENGKPQKDFMKKVLVP